MLSRRTVVELAAKAIRNHAALIQCGRHDFRIADHGQTQGSVQCCKCGCVVGPNDAHWYNLGLAASVDTNNNDEGVSNE